MTQGKPKGGVAGLVGVGVGGGGGVTNVVWRFQQIAKSPVTIFAMFMSV